jgi:hypothetical protein
MHSLSISSLRHLGLSALATLALAGAASAQALSAGEPISFHLEVLPILQNGCVECHKPGGEGYEASGLDLESYKGVMKGTKFGPVVVPGDPFTSNLTVLLEGRASPNIRMPFHRMPLRDEYVSIIRRWIAQGAKDN